MKLFCGLNESIYHLSVYLSIYLYFISIIYLFIIYHPFIIYHLST